ncbi:uncharacterized protein LOC111594532 [Drosophila hydei]|uniref:Uncharacterized protein LOC111594532 n=1 Tax=Drosophila hydei TaxID=7224 RepID=A0A6J1LJU4_DROHY|nr:uncharacterized protein LOC111594532 [Drosophila hydei]
MTDELTDETLDELFVKEVGSVVKIVENLPSNVAMATCARWLKIFQQATPAERFARNCMLLLLHKQLNDNNCLSYPFTDARSCQRDLRALHKMSLLLQHTESSVDDANNNINWDDNADSDDNDNIDTSSQISSLSLGMNYEENLLRVESDNKVLMEQNKEMAKELQALQSQKESLLRHREGLKAKAETLREQVKLSSKEIDCLKHIFSCSAVTALQLFRLPDFMEYPNYFVTLFSVLCEDEQDRVHFELMDFKLGRILRSHMEYYVSLTTRDQINRAYKEIHEKVTKRYKKDIKMQEETQLHDLSLITMRYLVTLRQLFLGSYKGDSHVEQLVLNFLQYQYNEIAEAL